MIIFSFSENHPMHPTVVYSHLPPYGGKTGHSSIQEVLIRHYLCPDEELYLWEKKRANWVIL